jgi:hypothetical protein
MIEKKLRLPTASYVKTVPARRDAGPTVGSSAGSIARSSSIGQFTAYCW